MSNLYFSGPVDPGKPIISAVDYSSSNSTSTQKGSNSKSDDKDDPNAFYGHTVAYKEAESKISLAKMQIRQELLNSLNSYQGDRGAFLADVKTQQLIMAMHKMDAVKSGLKNDIEQEKSIGEEHIKRVQSEGANQDFVYDDQGRRAFMQNDGRIMFVSEDEGAKLKRASSGNYTNNEQFMNYQKENLSVDGNGIAEKGYYSRNVNHNISVLTTELTNHAHASAGKNNSQENPLVFGNSYLNNNSGQYSLIYSGTKKTSSNASNLDAYTKTLYDKLSKNAIEEARMEYWHLGMDEQMFIDVSRRSNNRETIETHRITRDRYEAIQEKKRNGVELTTEEEGLLNGRKKTEDEKLKIYVTMKAGAMAAGLSQSEVTTKLDWHKLSEAESGYKLSGLQQTTMGFYSDPNAVEHTGKEVPTQPVFWQAIPKTSDFQKHGFRSFIAEIPPVVGSYFTKYNTDYLADKYDKGGELKFNKLTSPSEHFVSQEAFTAGAIKTALPVNWASIPGVKFVSWGNKIMTAPEIKSTGGGKQTFNFVNNNAKGDSYQLVKLAIDSDALEALMPHIPNTEGRAISDPNNPNKNSPVTDFDMLNNNNILPGFSASKYSQDLLGLADVPKDGSPTDVTYLEVYVKVNQNSSLNQVDNSATKHNMAVQEVVNGR